jgi:DNA repair protein RadC
LIAAERTPQQLASVDRILAEFDTAAAAIWGSPARLRRANIGDEVIDQLQAVRRTVVHVLRQPVLERPILATGRALLDYLRADMGLLAVEQVRALFLNARNMLIRDEIVSEGTIDEASVHVREVIQRALELGTASMILVHNHPSGDPSPTRADVDLTSAIASAGAPLGIVLHDHLIVSNQGHTSMRSRGLLA